MTPAQLEEIQKRCDAATAGPWIGRYDGGQIIAPTAGRTVIMAGAMVEADTRFIAHARQDIPALLDEVERLREALRYYADPKAWTEGTDDMGATYNFDWPGDLGDNPWDIANRALEGKS